jgi:hypothetical protein
MKKEFYLIILLFLLFPLAQVSSAELNERLAGKILLQVEEVGQAWYIDPVSRERAFLGRPADAFRVMRELGLGISEADFNFFNGVAPDRLSGRILLRVEANGEAYYVNPDDLRLAYLGRPADAFRVMRELGLGITNNDLTTIPISLGYAEPDAAAVIPPKESLSPVEEEEEEEEMVEEPIEVEPEDSIAPATSTWTGNIELDEASVNANQNTLTGGVGLVGRLRFDAKYEDAIIEDLVLENVGTAENNTLDKLYLFADSDMLELLGVADVASGVSPKAQFSNINILVEKVGVKYLYIGAAVKGIDYSSNPSPEATAEAESTIIIRVPTNTESFKTKVVGVTSGEDLGFLDLPTDNTRTTTVYGAIISNLVTGFENRILTNGIARDIFSFKVSVPESSNLDPDGEPLGIELSDISFEVSVSGSLSLSNFRIERIGGANGEVAASANYSAPSLDIDFGASYSGASDLTIRPGNTVEYVIRADISGVDSNESLQVTIEDLENNFFYTHSISASQKTSNIPPQLSGIDNLRGGVLSN